LRGKCHDMMQRKKTKSTTLIGAFAFNPTSYHLSALDMFWSRLAAASGYVPAKFWNADPCGSTCTFFLRERAIIHFERNLHYFKMHSCLDSWFQNVFPPFFYKRPLLDVSQLHEAVSKASLNHHFPLSILFELLEMVTCSYQSTKEFNYGIHAGQTNSSLTKFILNSISIYAFK